MLTALLTIAALHGAVLLVPDFNFIFIRLLNPKLAPWHPWVQRAWLRPVRQLDQASAAVVRVFGLKLLWGTWQERQAGGA